MTVRCVIVLVLLAACLEFAASFGTSFQSLRSLAVLKRTSRASPRDNAITASATTISSPSDISNELEDKQPSSSSFDKFDYNACWYPVIWVEDLPLRKPTRVTVFDVDYVVARLSDTDVVAMVDSCPHKAAALSEGRVTSSGYFQCAYHGWTFDGKDGTCVEIPQVLASEKTMPDVSRRACGTAVPATVSQRMVWLFPGGGLEEALLASPPPTVPEMDQPGFVTVTNVRDFPVDWSILLENILDPDHGVFAHGALGFDLYAASKEAPQMIEEETINNGKGWRITSRVNAVQKLVSFDKMRRGKIPKKAQDKDVKVATATFTAPNHVYMGRRDPKTGETAFLTAFWVCPVGTRRSRFMSASIAKAPFGIPRWLNHIVINNFLDQDTFLLATQQKYVLQAEAEAAKQIKEDNEDTRRMPVLNVRKKLYAYRSPAEKLQTRLGAFWDATLSCAPNRMATLLKMDRSNQLSETPQRLHVLDREEQHLKVCPDSQAVVENCNRLQRASLLASLLVGASKLLATVFGDAASDSIFGQWNALLKPTLVASVFSVSAIASWLAAKLRREFYFKYTEAFRDRDLKNIPKVWLDKS